MTHSRYPIRAIVVRLTLLAAIATAWLPGGSAAQDLEPRAFSPAPVGLNFGVVGYGFASGNVLLDSSIPITNATADVNQSFAVYVRTFGFFGMSSKITGILPFAWGEWRGKVAGRDSSTTRTGIGDVRLQWSFNFHGAPALSAREFAQRAPGTVAGASLDVIAPTGHYDSSKIVNLGSNRWSFRPRVGVSQPFRRWTFELFASVWLFVDNTDGPGGVTVEQGPIYAMQGHVLYQFRPGLWAAINGGYGLGGQTTVDGVEQDTEQRNTRLGGVVAYSFAGRHAFKLAYVSAFSTRIGADFDQVTLFYQIRWGGGL